MNMLSAAVSPPLMGATAAGAAGATAAAGAAGKMTAAGAGCNSREEAVTPLAFSLGCKSAIKESCKFVRPMTRSELIALIHMPFVHKLQEHLQRAPIPFGIPTRPVFAFQAYTVFLYIKVVSSGGGLIYINGSG
jgi:hypothetical protein